MMVSALFQQRGLDPAYPRRMPVGRRSRLKRTRGVDNVRNLTDQEGCARGQTELEVNQRTFLMKYAPQIES